MATKSYHVEETKCDQCGKKYRNITPDCDVGLIPPAWKVITASNDPVERGNERLFVELCPGCYAKLPFRFHGSGDAEE